MGISDTSGVATGWYDDTYTNDSYAEWFYKDCQDGYERYCDIFTQFIFFMLFVGVSACFKEKEIIKVIFPLIILGGFLFHTIDEGSSQYILPYYILMTAFAGCGAVSFYDFCEKRLPKNKLTKLFMFK